MFSEKSLKTIDIKSKKFKFLPLYFNLIFLQIKIIFNFTFKTKISNVSLIILENLKLGNFFKVMFLKSVFTTLLNEVEVIFKLVIAKSTYRKIEIKVISHQNLIWKYNL